jgi:hypothetical protein
MSIKFGSIPEHLKIFVKPQEAIPFRWDDIEVNEDTRVVLGRPSFVTDLTNKKTQETAARWAQGYNYRTKKDIGFDIVERPNTSFNDVRVIGLDIRGNGGRAWQVLLDGIYVIDMREDVLMDCLLNGGVSPDARLSGDFIFASVNSEMKIIRVGSLLHDKMIESTEYNAKKPISKLEVGGIYRNKKSTVIYLGEVWTTHLEVERKSNGWSYGTRRPDEYHYRLHFPRKCHLTIEVNFESGDTKINTKDICYYSMNWNKSIPKSFKEKLGQIDTPVQKILDAIKERSIREYKIETQPPHYQSGYSDMLNASLTEGYIHPIVRSAVPARMQ